MRHLMLLATMLALATPHAARAQDSVADFYRGKRLFLQVGSETGGGYDLVGRAVARHIAKYIPGSPTIVVQNVVGGGSVKLGNDFYNIAPRDGTYVALCSNGMPTAPLLAPESVKFDPRRFSWIGSTNREIEVLVVWHSAAVKTIDDVFKMPLIAGASSPGSATYDYPLVANALLGTKFKIVNGYSGATQVKLAMERGEVEANAALAFESAKTGYGDVLGDGKLKLMAQWGFEPHPQLQSTPLVPVGKDPEIHQILAILYARGDYGRPFFTPPDVPEERVAALRKAFAATMQDKDFLADTAKLHLDIDPVTGEDLQSLTDRLMATPPAVIERLRTLLSAKAKAN
jgi:tripartite-type tricarboxylate transporter receptor subunit TctC